jgi:hypothetical protein
VPEPEPLVGGVFHIRVWRTTGVRKYHAALTHDVMHVGETTYPSWTPEAAVRKVMRTIGLIVARDHLSEFSIRIDFKDGWDGKATVPPGSR